jgi:adenylyltransferase/sulfurtransferase
MVPSCQEAGVLGAVAGIIGILQANEALKEILGLGESMAGRFLIFNALNLSFHEVKIAKNSNCPLCGENPRIKELIEYPQVCQA